MHKLVFLNHSGFLIELEHAVLVFDMYTDPASVLSQYVESTKAFYFFVSHAHYDHWNSEILDFNSRGTRTYFLDQSCQLPEDFEQEDLDRFYQASSGERFHLSTKEQEKTGVISIEVFGSTDEGSSFLVTTHAGKIFHSGDLNLWDWEREGETDLAMEAAYRGELIKIQEALEQETLWISMLPVDSRLGAKAFSGAEVFLEYIKTRFLVPDHLNGGVNLPRELQELVGDKTEVLTMTTPGVTITL